MKQRNEEEEEKGKQTNKDTYIAIKNVTVTRDHISVGCSLHLQNSVTYNVDDDDVKQIKRREKERETLL